DAPAETPQAPAPPEMPAAPASSRPAGKSKVEIYKEESLGLRGRIREDLASDVDHVDEATANLLKFHGTYQQDNRDTRKLRRKQGLDKEYIFMVRNRIPGGKITGPQFLAELEIAEQFGNGTLRITTR